MSQAMDSPILPVWWQRPGARALGVAAGLGLALLLAMLLTRGMSERSLTVARTNVTLATVARGLFHDFVPLHGTVVPKDTIYLDALAGGQVEKILAQAGDRVIAGQKLVVLRNSQLQLDVLNGEGRLVESLTQVQAQQTALENTRIGNETALENIRFNITNLQHTLARYEKLLAQGGISEREVEQARDQLTHFQTLLPLQQETNRQQEASRRTQLPGLQAFEKSLQQSLETTRRELDDLTVTAPVSGQITQLDLKIGENRNRGERLAEITPDTGFKISADTDEYYLGRVKRGQTAEVTLSGTRYGLHVARVYPAVKSGVFTVDLTFDGAMPNGLSPGATADGKLSLGGDRPGPVLPAGAFLEASGGDYVFVLDQGGKSAHRRRVKLGRRNGEQVEVLSGLAAGERVITSDYATYDRIDRIDLN
jgi:HlyD family secretion protein